MEDYLKKVHNSYVSGFTEYCNSIKTSVCQELRKKERKKNEKELNEVLLEVFQKISENKNNPPQKGSGLPSSYFSDGLTYTDRQNYLPIDMVESSQTYLSPIVYESRPPFIYQFGGKAKTAAVQKEKKTLMENLFKHYNGTKNISSITYKKKTKEDIVNIFLESLKQQLNNNNNKNKK